MMKRSTLRLLAAISIFAAPISVKAATVQLVFSKDFSEREQLRLRPVLQSRWAEWSASYGNAYLPGNLIKLRKLARGEDSSIAGRMSGGEIRVRANAVLEHELAHLFIDAKCPGWRHETFLHEALALWISKDYARIEKARPWLLYDEALAFLKRAEQPESAHFEEALSRVISQNTSSFEEFSQKAVPGCIPDARELLLNVLGLGGGKQEIPGELRYLVMDGASGRIIDAKGDFGKSAPVGSVLKPWLISSFSDLRRPLPGKESWKCPSNQETNQLRLWHWTEAMVRSCNGFFIDHPFLGEAEWTKFAATAKSLGLPPPPKQKGALIGIIPAYRMNPEEIARLYRYLSLSHADVLRELSGVPVYGTLSGADSAEWFAEHGFLMKTGSVRGKDSVPLESWIVAILPGAESPALVAVIQAEGIATRDLTRELRTVIEPHLKSMKGKAGVQVLGLQDGGELRLRCGKGQEIIERAASGKYRFRKAWLTKKELRKNHSYMCASGPLEVSAGRGEAMSRFLYGSLSFNPRSLSLRKAGNRRQESRDRARNGSSFVLSTSEFEYVFSTVASEFPNGNMETLKALALVVRENGRRGHRHPNGLPCDTTHCQVFAHSNLQPYSGRGSRISGALHAISGVSLISNLDWFPFALGGKRGWQKLISSRELTEAFGDVTEIAIQDGELFIKNGAGALQSKRCEDVRNQLSLFSCPDSVRKEANSWIFSGVGEGHGLGMDLELADALSGSGASYKALLKRFYRADLEE